MLTVNNEKETSEAITACNIERVLLLKKFESEINALGASTEAGDTVKQEQAQNLREAFRVSYKELADRQGFLMKVQGYYVAEWARAGAGDQEVLQGGYGITVKPYGAPPRNVTQIVGDLIDINPLKFLAAKTIDGKVWEDDSLAGTVIDYKVSGGTIKLVKMERSSIFSQDPNRKTEWWQGI